MTSSIQPQNTEIAQYLQDQYSSEQIDELLLFLQQKGTFRFPTLPSGLFSAAITSPDTDYTGYQQAWVRDNIHIAHALYVTGEKAIAVKAIQALMTYFQKHHHRFDSIIAQPALAQEVMNRPHIRFDGKNLAEISQNWSHAQNDALGYFLWFFCKLIQDNVITPSPEDLNCLALFPQYFDAVQYWQDEDNGHWEETRKIEASSIGTVIAGLKQYQHLSTSHLSNVNTKSIEALIKKGEQALHEILPYECRQPHLERPYDSALLFLIYPLQAVEGAIAQQIINDVINHLQGNIGIKRYLNDSFWTANYKSLLAPNKRTMNMSSDLTERNALSQAEKEAQWCIFDPILSVIYGQQYLQTRAPQAYTQQIKYFNRTLAQITASDCELGGYLCPELYYFEDEQQQPNDATPLLWSQANLLLAFHFMKRSSQH